MEINFLIKRKRGFVIGTIVRYEDYVLVDRWDIRNNIVIFWIFYVVLDYIK